MPPSNYSGIWAWSCWSLACSPQRLSQLGHVPGSHPLHYSFLLFLASSPPCLPSNYAFLFGSCLILFCMDVWAFLLSLVDWFWAGQRAACQNQLDLALPRMFVKSGQWQPVWVLASKQIQTISCWTWWYVAEWLVPQCPDPGTFHFGNVTYWLSYFEQLTQFPILLSCHL